MQNWVELISIACWSIFITNVHKQIDFSIFLATVFRIAQMTPYITSNVRQIAKNLSESVYINKSMSKRHWNPQGNFASWMLPEKNELCLIINRNLIHTKFGNVALSRRKYVCPCAVVGALSYTLRWRHGPTRRNRASVRQWCIYKYVVCACRR